MTYRDQAPRSDIVHWGTELDDGLKAIPLPILDELGSAGRHRLGPQDACLPTGS